MIFNAIGSYTTWTYQEWEAKIAAHFERVFWVNWTPAPEHEPRPELIHRRGIYKDSHNASQAWADYQLRPNFTIAMIVVSKIHVNIIAVRLTFFPPKVPKI